MGDRLGPAERATLESILLHGKPRYTRRAALLLRWDDGMPLESTASEVGLSPRRVRYWQGRFLKERLQVFPPHVLRDASLPARTKVPAPSPDQIDCSALSAGDGANEAQARHMAAHALRLYDLTAELHALPAQWRALVEPAAWLFAAGLAADPRAPHRAAQNIALRDELPGCSPEQRQILACAMLLQRKKRQALASTLYAALPAPMQRGALTLAALLRMAEGLDSSGTQSSVLGEVVPGPASLKIQVSGPEADQEATAATARADLWELVSPLSLVYTPHAPRHLPDLALKGKPDKGPGLTADDPMSEAGRKVLLFHFRRMLEHQPGTCAGEDIEELHRMRVATRRMRAAFRVFGAHFEPKSRAPFVKWLKRTAQALGAVRDLDVFMEKAAAYVAAQPDTEQSSLDPLLDAWRDEREAARLKMLAHLNSDKYAEFCWEFAKFVQTPGAGALIDERAEPRPTLVAHVAPQEIYQRLAEVRALGIRLDDAPLAAYHGLRIRCKHLRYTIEFFEEALGPEAKEVIQRVVALQDHLGNLQDAAVATDLLRGFLNEQAEREKTERVTQRIAVHGVTQYLATRQAEIGDLLAGFPAVWADLESVEFRKKLAQAIAAL